MSTLYAFGCAVLKVYAVVGVVVGAWIVACLLSTRRARRARERQFAAAQADYLRWLEQLPVTTEPRERLGG